MAVSVYEPAQISMRNAGRSTAEMTHPPVVRRDDDVPMPIQDATFSIKQKFGETLNKYEGGLRDRLDRKCATDIYGGP
jgi:hypothetical protein